MDTKDPAVTELLSGLEQSSGAPVVMNIRITGTGAFTARVSYCYPTPDGKLGTRCYELDEPLPSVSTSDQRRDRVLVLLRRALMGSRSDGRVLK